MPITIMKPKIEAGGVLWLLLAFLFCVLGTIGAVEKLPLKKLHGDDGKDEHKELIDDEDVEDVLQRCHDAVKHRLGDKEVFIIEKNP